MTQSLAIPRVIPNDWKRLDLIVNKIKMRLGSASSPTFAGLTITGLTASTLIGANASKALESITVGTGLDYTRPNLTLSHLGIEALTDPGADRILFWDNTASACKWLGMGNSVAITDVTLDTIQDIRTTASPTFAGLTVVNTITEFSTDGTMGGNSDSAVPTEKATKLYTDTLRSDLASTSNAKGASLVGIEDSAAQFDAGDVEAALSELIVLVTPVEYNPAMSRTAGGDAGGNDASVATIDDADSYDTDEISATPGFDIQAVFTGVTDFNQVQIHTAYDGNPAHVVRIDLDKTPFNWSSFDTILADIDDSSGDFVFNAITVASAGQYINSGEVRLRFYHSSAGNATHDFFIDYCALWKTGTSVGVTEHGGLTGLGDDDHLQYIKDAEFTQDSGILVGTGAGTFAEETGATLRTSLGLGTGDSPTFAALTVTTINGLGVKYTATGNIAIGDSTTLDALDTDPTHNIAIGDGAGSGITDGDNNIFIGYRAGYEKTTHQSNIAIGYEAWYKGTGNYAVAIGYQAGRYHSAGNNNVLVGHQAGLGVITGATYVYNVVVGSGSGVALTDGSYNVLLGYYSGNDLTSGDNNIFVGHLSGAKQTTLSNLLIVDSQTRADAATEATNAILYGVMAATPASQTLRINAVTTISQTLTGLSTAAFEGASVTVGKASTTTGTIVLHDSGSANTITLTVPNALAGSLSFTLPPTDGDNLDVLQTNGSGVLTWVVPSGGGGFTSRFYASLSSSQTINPGTWTKILFNSEVFDGDGEYDNATHYRFTATDAGYYWVGVCLRYYPTVANKYIQAAVLKNGTDYILSSQTGTNATTNALNTICFGLVYLAATDYIEAETFHNFGPATGTVLGAATRPTYFCVHRLS